MTQYVYMLYDYEEHGPERLGITLDRNRLPDLLKQEWPVLDGSENGGPAGTYINEGYVRDALDQLSQCLLKTDDELCAENHALVAGWGSITLRVEKLFE